MSSEVGFGIEVEAGFEEEDPKVVLAYTLRDNMQLTKDDGVTPALCYVGFSLPPESLKELFAKYDIVITVKLHMDNSRSLAIGSFDRLHESNYLLEVYCIDKEGVTAKKLRWRTTQEIRRVLRLVKPPENILSWDFVSSQDVDHTSVRPYMYQASIIVKVKWIERGE